MPNVELVGAESYNTLKPIAGKKSFKKGEPFVASEPEWVFLDGERNPGNGAKLFELTDREPGAISDLALAGLGDLTAEEVRRGSTEIDTSVNGGRRAGKTVAPISPEEQAELDALNGPETDSAQKSDSDPATDAPKASEGSDTSPTTDAPPSAPEGSQAPSQVSADAPKPKATLKIGGKAAATPPAPPPGDSTTV